MQEKLSTPKNNTFITTSTKKTINISTNYCKNTLNSLINLSPKIPNKLLS